MEKAKITPKKVQPRGLGGEVTVRKKGEAKEKKVKIYALRPIEQGKSCKVLAADERV